MNGPVERFVDAVRRRDAGGLRAVLEREPAARAAINEPLFGFDSPAVREVSSDDDTAVLDVLLELGADPNRRSNWWAGGFHALHSASPNAAERLIAAGATVDACAAAHLDRLDLLAEIVNTDPSHVHERGGDGQTPLHFARSTHVIDFLLQHGADIDARDVDHRSTAAEWMISDRKPLAAHLVESGASADIFLVAALGLPDRAREMLSSDSSPLSRRTSQGYYGEKRPSSYHIYTWTLGPNLTPLHVAAKFGNEETMRAMIEFATPGQRLMLACHRGEDSVARALVEANPSLIRSLDAADQRALTDEAWTANANAVALMLDLGFDPSLPSASGPGGGNALHCAAWEGATECMEALLRHASGRALIEARDPSWNGTPLSWCCHGSVNCGNPNARHADVARQLIAAGASVTPEMNDWGGSPAFQAVINEALSR